MVARAVREAGEFRIRPALIGANVNYDFLRRCQVFRRATRGEYPRASYRERRARNFVRRFMRKRIFSRRRVGAGLW